MDSKSGRLPFSLSGSRSSYTTPSSYSASSSSLGSSRLYGRERLLSSDRFPRSSTTLKPEPDLKGSRYLGSSREYGGGGSSDSRAPSWKLPSSLSSAAYERPRANSTLCSHDKLTDPERRLGSYSGLLPSDDGDSKRAKLSYSSRAAYPRATTTTTTSSTTAGSLYPRATTTPSSTTAGSLYSSSRLTSSTDSGDKRTDSWSDASLRRSAGLSSSSSRPSSSSSSSSSLWSSSPSFPSARRDAERRAELRSELTERRVRSSATSTSSLYPTDRLTSSYAQGARPKETVYSSTTTSSVARESSLGRCHLPPPSSTSSSSYQSQTSARSLRTSSGLRLPHQEARVFSSPPSPPSPHVSSTSAWHNIKSQYQNARGRRSDATPPSPSPSPPPPPAPPTPPSPTQRPAESDGRLSTRRLLFRLFSRRSGQESSSSSSSSSSSPPSSSSSSSSSPTVPRPRAASNTAAPPPSSSSSSSSVAGAGGAEPEPRVVDTVQAFAFLRRRRQDLTPIEETPRQASGGGGGGRGSSSSSSWLTSSLRSRCPPLFSRHRRESPDEDVRLHTLRRPTVAPDPQHKSSDEEDEDDEEDDEEEDEEEGAGASGATGPGGVIRVRPIRAACRERGSAPSNAAVAVYRDILVGVDARYQAEGRGTETKPDPSRDPERLRKIQESLMLEDSDEEEGDLCRICQMGEDSAGTDPLIQPCRCTGSLQYVHQDCIKKWLRSKISSGTDLEAITTCELCKQKLHLNIDNFDVSELYRTHVQSECEFVSSGLYLVVLLHLCEQRFSDVLGAANEAGSCILVFDFN
ncbi:E3 ubiquitin-protein ligase MARCH7 [Merluccius polli]|uniref:RING-type E3 ubiquitin transferase n=1 Tax=Merluccius polli TaxID=89951 RepID=A0AA47PBS0_MERPO|nr:E3 ubiquitin-protein ligase MARCH7 [Merluccius polli]